jgi:RimJ/RimL family protein N-acetyltransferase
MPWAREAEDREVIVQRLREFRARFDRDEDYTVGVWSPGEDELMGGLGLHARVEAGAREIGYWIGVRHEGRGYVSEGVAAMTRFAFELAGLKRLQICVDPANERSLAVPRRLGYVQEAVLRGRLEGGADSVVFSMFAEDFPQSPCASASLEAYGPAGDRWL